MCRMASEKYVNLNIPPSSSTVEVSIIDTTFDARLPTAMFMGPPVKGFERWNGVAYVFLVSHTDSSGTEREVLFDLGAPKGMLNDFPPKMAEAFKDLDGYMRVDKNVADILEEGGVELGSIEAIIWRFVNAVIAF